MRYKVIAYNALQSNYTTNWDAIWEQATLMQSIRLELMHATNGIQMHRIMWKMVNDWAQARTIRIRADRSRMQMINRKPFWVAKVIMMKRNQCPIIMHDDQWTRSWFFANDTEQSCVSGIQTWKIGMTRFDAWNIRYIFNLIFYFNLKCLLFHSAITKILGDWWANLDDTEKSSYTNLAKEVSIFLKNQVIRWAYFINILEL